jgi:hypothetical protein
MPLSEHEQRILAELEESLSKHDPSFVKSVRETTSVNRSGRRVRWGVAGFVAGLVILILCFSQSVLLGLVGVALMFASAIVVERNARQLGRSPWGDPAASAGSDGGARSLRAWLSRRRKGE